MTYSQIIKRLRLHQKYVITKLSETNVSDWSVLCTCLRGSQNYGLDHANSDVDSLTVVVPTARSFVLAKTFSKEYTLDKEKLTVIDIQSYVRQLKKANPALLETAFTDYFITPDNKYDSYKDELKEIAEKLLYCQPKATAFSVIGDIFSFLKKVYCNDDYNAKAMCGAYRLYEWLVSYLKDELDDGAPFEMKDPWFMYNYWEMRIADRGEDYDIIYNDTKILKDALVTDDFEKLCEHLDAEPVMLNATKKSTLTKLDSWCAKVFEKLNSLDRI